MAPNALVHESFFELLQGPWLHARHQVEGIVTGLHRSRQHGAGALFVEHRPYRPGDDVRKLDWHAYARTDRDVVKHYEQESQLRTHLLLDTSASMYFGDEGRHKCRYAASLLATFAYALIRRGDAVGCATFDETLHPHLAPRATPSQLTEVFELLEGALKPGAGRSGGTALAASLGAFAATAPPRGLIIVASDLLDFAPEALAVLRQLSTQGSDVVVLQVLTEAELVLPGAEPYRYEGLEADGQAVADPEDVRQAYQATVQAFVNESQAACRRAGAVHQLCPTHEAPETRMTELLHNLKHRGRGR